VFGPMKKDAVTKEIPVRADKGSFKDYRCKRASELKLGPGVGLKEEGT